MCLLLFVPDVNECEANPCSQECANVYGSYQCYCRRGYQLSDLDGVTCEGKTVGVRKNLMVLKSSHVISKAANFLQLSFCSHFTFKMWTFLPPPFRSGLLKAFENKPLSSVVVVVVPLPRS